MTTHAHPDAQLATAGDLYIDSACDWTAPMNVLLAPYKLRIRQLLTTPSGVAAQLVYDNGQYLKYFCTRAHSSRDELYDLIYEAIDDLGRMEDDDVNIFSTELFEYLSGEMIGEASITLTIKGVVLEELTNSRGTEKKPVVTFEEREKKLVLNKSNARTLAAELGKETNDWRGRQVVLEAPYISAFGQRMRSVQITRVLKPAASGNGQHAAPPDEQWPDMRDANGPLFDEEE